MHAETGLDAFHLSRIGAWAEHQGTRIEASRAQASGPGVLLCAGCDGATLSFWTTQADWCAWMAPHLPLPSLTHLNAELMPVLSAWTLAPLDNFLRQHNQPGLTAATAAPANAPPGLRWRIRISHDSLCLPLYLQDAPPDWLPSLLTLLPPPDGHSLRLALGLGWCLLPEQDWEQVSVGDALPIQGMADSLDTLWLHPPTSPGQIRLIHGTRAIIENEAPGLRDVPTGTLRLEVEAAIADVEAPALAGWQAGTEIAMPVLAHLALRLTCNGHLYALGQLLRLDNGWAIRIQTRQPA